MPIVVAISHHSSNFDNTWELNMTPGPYVIRDDYAGYTRILRGEFNGIYRNRMSHDPRESILHLRLADYELFLVHIDYHQKNLGRKEDFVKTRLGMTQVRRTKRTSVKPKRLSYHHPYRVKCVTPTMGTWPWLHFRVEHNIMKWLDCKKML